MIANLGCRCGRTTLEVKDDPMVVTECLCNSCREAGRRLHVLGIEPPLLTPYGATACAEYRKDRVRLTVGREHLRELRLTATAGTRRVVAGCCQTPLFLEMKGAHWLSVYCHLWPEASRPRATVRTMTADLASTSGLPADIPNLETQSVSFYLKLAAAWIAMGFRCPDLGRMEPLD